ncbi:MAG: hypothetical protein L6M37_06925 [Candidatus Methylarchaceae archaeon HK02M1]|nr:hypothetical protein [Candidatus Methylarchaceae archaeon HK02M1]
MKISLMKGFCFGLASGVITTLGMIVGLYASTNSKMAVIGGIMAIAIADALSDALGMHISEEAECQHSTKEIWESTISTFLSKLVFASTFIVPVLFFDLYVSIIISVIWGLSLIISISYIMARQQGEKSQKVILEHLLVVIVVIIATYYVGEWISTFI